MKDVALCDLQIRAGRRSGWRKDAKKTSILPSLAEAGPIFWYVDEFPNQFFDYVLTVCDNGRETCPVYAGQTNRGTAPASPISPMFFPRSNK